MTGHRRSRIAVAVAVGLLAAGTVLGANPQAAASSTHAGSRSFAPVNQAAPALSIARRKLAAAVTCRGDFHNGKEPVLLVPGTAFTYQTQYSWSWAPALTRRHIPWCAVSPPYRQLGRIDIAGEYDAYAIRHTFHKAGNRKIAIVGHSQGGMQPRWALRFWPDTRKMVADYVGVAPDNQGVDLGTPALAPSLINTTCTVSGCPQGVWQQIRASHFMDALNSRQETFRGIDYSVIYSEEDELARPNDTPLAAAPGVAYRRVSVQTVCPGRIVDHLENGTTDAATWAMVMDAITHPGPIKPSRINRSVCNRFLLPGMTYATALRGAAGAAAEIARAVAGAQYQSREAALPNYVYAGGRSAGS